MCVCVVTSNSCIGASNSLEREKILATPSLQQQHYVCEDNFSFTSDHRRRMDSRDAYVQKMWHGRGGGGNEIFQKFRGASNISLLTFQKSGGEHLPLPLNAAMDRSMYMCVCVLYLDPDIISPFSFKQIVHTDTAGTSIT